MSSYGKYDDRRRRDSSPSRHRRDRRPSPGPSSRDRSPPKPRDDKELPEQFGRGIEDNPDDDYTVLQRMKKSYKTSPLGCIYKCIDGSRKLKVWTRNFKEVRGICTGYVLAFDKHWNLIMTDVDEVYLKPRKAKTPFLSDIRSSDPPLPDLEPKVPKKKKDPAVAAEEKPTEESQPEVKVEETQDKPEGEKSEKKKRRRKKKKGPTTENRTVNQFFVRGDNIVMIAILDNESKSREEEEEESDKDSSKDE